MANRNAREVFREKLPQLMDKARMNQADLAKAVGKSEASVSLWLSGGAFPRIDTIQKIVTALNCSYEDLFERKLLVTIAGYSDDKQTSEMMKLWTKLNSSNKKAVFNLMKSLEEDQEDLIL